jgi:hypothetical protein
LNKYFGQFTLKTYTVTIYTEDSDKYSIYSSEFAGGIKRFLHIPHSPLLTQQVYKLVSFFFSLRHQFNHIIIINFIPEICKFVIILSVSIPKYQNHVSPTTPDIFLFFYIFFIFFLSGKT